jgi:hypothetical protein
VVFLKAHLEVQLEVYPAVCPMVFQEEYLEA